MSLSPYMQSRLKMKQGLAKTSQEVKAEQPKKPIAKAAKKIAPVSEKRKEENKEYTKEAKAYLAAHPICEGQIAEGCTGKGVEIHHKRKRNSKDDRVNPDNFLSVCRPCHLRIESHPKQAKELGLSESHLKSK